MLLICLTMQPLIRCLPTPSHAQSNHKQFEFQISDTVPRVAHYPQQAASAAEDDEDDDDGFGNRGFNAGPLSTRPISNPTSVTHLLVCGCVGVYMCVAWLIGLAWLARLPACVHRVDRHCGFVSRFHQQRASLCSRAPDTHAT